MTDKISDSKNPSSAADSAAKAARDFQREMQDRIAAEVDKRRGEGKYPPSFEAKLRTVYEGLLPKGSTKDSKDLSHLMYMVDRTAFMDIDVPLASNKPGVSKLKTVLRKLMAWYLNYLLQQLTNFHANLLQLLHAYDLRMQRIERRLTEFNSEAPALPVVLTDDAVGTILSHLGGPEGRILVTSCTSSSLLSQLDANGYDAYGIDTDTSRLDALASKGTDARFDAPYEHVAGLKKSALQAVILQGTFELLSTADKVALLKMLKTSLVKGGKLIVLGRPVASDLEGDLRIAVDLAPGRLFASETWQYLLSRNGYSCVAQVAAVEGGLFIVGAVGGEE